MSLEQLTYAWNQTDGQTVTLTSENTATPTFTAPNPTRIAATLSAPADCRTLDNSPAAPLSSP